MKEEARESPLLFAGSLLKCLNEEKLARLKLGIRNSIKIPAFVAGT